MVLPAPPVPPGPQGIAGPQGQQGWAPELVTPESPIAEWIAPSAPRVANAPGNGAATNPVQAWATLVENISPASSAPG